MYVQAGCKGVEPITREERSLARREKHLYSAREHVRDVHLMQYQMYILDSARCASHTVPDVHLVHRWSVSKGALLVE